MNNLAKFSKFQEVTLDEVSINGWLKSYLIDQKNGLTGHLDEIGYPFNTHCWGVKDGKQGGLRAWWPYEQVAYYLDAISRCGHALNDDFLIDKFTKDVDSLIADQDEDGFLGAYEIKEDISNAQWPHSILARGILAHYFATKDDKYLNALVRHYKSKTCKYNQGRDMANVETIITLYGITGDKYFLDLAETAFAEFNKLDTSKGEYDQVMSNNDVSLAGLASDNKITTHGVTFSELSKIGVVLYLYTGKDIYLKPCIHGFAKAEKQALLVDGVVSSTEGLKSNTPDDCHESCDITDYTWALGYLLMATGDAHYADIIENAMLNAAPSVHYNHFKTLLYFSAPNMVIGKPNSNSAKSYSFTPRMAYQPHHYPECCVANVQRAMPNYVARMYMEQENGVVANFYADSTLDKVVNGNHIVIEQKTAYPFDETVNFSFKCDDKFSFTYRIPEWCKSATVTLNGACLSFETGYNTVEVANGDNLVIKFDMPVTVQKWATGGLYVKKGALLYSLKIEENIELDIKEKRQTKDFPAYSMTPATPFNYAINLEKALETATVKKLDMSENPFFYTPHEEITLTARVLNNWDITKVALEDVEYETEAMESMIARGTGVIDDDCFEITPPFPTDDFVKANLGEEKTITLVPYGCTNLRLAVFPEF